MTAVISEMLEVNPAQQSKRETAFLPERVSADQVVNQTLQAALTSGIGSTDEKPATASANATAETKTPRMLRVMFWIVIAVSAGAIVAALTII